MIRCVAPVLILALIGAGCSLGGGRPGWQDANLHAVDGYLITGETPCRLGADDACGGVVAPAIAAHRSMGGGLVTGAALANLPRIYYDADGNEIVMNSGGNHLVILDVAGGARRVIGVSCRPQTEPGSCSSDGTGSGAFEQYRVGWVMSSG